MGFYRRKVHKKKSMGLFHGKGLEDLIEDEVDFFYRGEGGPDSAILDMEYPSMLDEPDIVKELKEEERLGKLQTLVTDFQEAEKQQPTSMFAKRPDMFEETESMSEKIKSTSYDDALALAKRALDEVIKD
jgi:hypothetical protein